MPHDTDLIDIIAVGLFLAFIFGTIANKLRLSPLIGYLLAGVVCGPFTPGFVADAELANQLSEIGVMLLMFGVGLHFSLDDLLEVRNIAIPGAIAQIAVATGLGWLLAWGLGWTVMQGVVFGLALSVASTVVLLRTMEQHRLLDTARGRIAVGWLIVEDLVMVLALVLLPALAGMAEAGGEPSGSDKGAIEAMLVTVGVTLVKVGAFVAVMLLVGRRLIPWALEMVAGTGSRELFTLAVLGIALGVAFGSALLFGVSFALGAFFAGMLLNESELSHKAANDSLPLRDAFAVLFFVSVGMLFDWRILIEQPLLVLGTLAIIVGGKSLAAFAIVRAFGHPSSTALTISASLAQIGEFSFILAGLGVSLEILPASGRDLVLAGALLSIVVNPLLFAWVERRQARIEAAESAAGAPTPEPEPAPGPPLDGPDHAIVVGYGRVGSQLAPLLKSRGVPLLVIDDNPELVERAHAAGIPAIRGNAASERVMAEARPAEAAMAIIAIPRAFEAGEIIARLREANPGLTIFARAHSDAEVRHLLEHGADGAVMAERELAYSMAEMIMASPPYRTGSLAPASGG
ncbi:YbaL family putative K(+) efflux transporter [Coralloluteibacterium stylophorae]|uniref:Kef family K(+) transporter n=2 Tax=Coralloluteibacterium stylophorae TaxID=1776034 RepID=A0AAP2CA59_9GAMM|nr:YbaL family putative K(+) efflux transporter [Coralloluteibacterium stylophorae]MBS7456807.1 Kef family K(+) transporter [Coralloluteibacterium stylophorae]